VSFNAEPPLEDPRLASDVDTGRCHDRFRLDGQRWLSLPALIGNQDFSGFRADGGEVLAARGRLRWEVRGPLGVGFPA
jgi:hypothetical protein